MRDMTKKMFLYKNLSLALAFCKIDFTMLSPEKVRSKIAQRYLILSLGSIVLPLHSIFKFDHGMSFDLEPN